MQRHAGASPRRTATCVTQTALERHAAVTAAGPTGDRLERGVVTTDRCGRRILFRFLAPSDDVEAITKMLHEAYAPLAASGMRFVASHQDADVTRRRMAAGE